MTRTEARGGDNPASPPGPKIDLIIGAVVGGLVGLFILLLIGAFILYKRKIRKIRGQCLEDMEERRRARGAFGGMFGHGRRERTVTASGASEPERRGTDELLNGAEPSFWGVFLSPRRSLRVVNP